MVNNKGYLAVSGVSSRNYDLVRGAFKKRSLRCRRVLKGEGWCAVLFKKEDAADKLFYIADGMLYLKEIDKHVGKGEIIGETGILSPFHQRTISALCETDLEVSQF